MPAPRRTTWIRIAAVIFGLASVGLGWRIAQPIYRSVTNSAHGYSFEPLTSRLNLPTLTVYGLADWINIAIPVAILLALAAVTGLLARVFWRSATGPTPFTAANAKDLKWVAALTLCGTINAFSSGVLDSPKTGQLTLTLDVPLLICAALLGCLAAAFAKGAVLQIQADETW